MVWWLSCDCCMLHCFSVRISQRVLEQISIEKLFYNLRNKNKLYHHRVILSYVSIWQLKPNCDLMIQLCLCCEFVISSVLMEGLTGIMVKIFAIVWLTVNCFCCLSQQPALKATLNPDIIPKSEGWRLRHKPAVGKEICV